MMIVSIFLFLCLSTFQVSAYTDEEIRQLYKEWKLKFRSDNGASPSLKDDTFRFKLFRKSAKLIADINAKETEWQAGFTQFADMTEQEKLAYTGINGSLEEPELAAPISAALSELDPSDPPKKYWEMGAVQNQWSCGSCWSFASVGALEGLHIKEHAEYREFAEQTLLDCVYEGRRDGCNGGWSEQAVNWVGSNSPITKGKDYGYIALRADNSYEASDGECTDLKTPFENGMKRAKPYCYGASWKTQNDAGLQHALATEGPVIVYIYSSWALPFYTTGTYTGTGCGTDPIPNHAVVAAGYEKDYWYIKNSWGTTWGYSGYGYFSRSWENLCSISSRRKTIQWRPNRNFDVCTDVPTHYRSACVDDRVLSESECTSRGCCYDRETDSKNLLKCFTKGKIHIYDGEGHRRVLYGSTPDFTAISFAATAKTVEVESGTWVLYGDNDYWNKPSKVVTAKDGKVRIDVQSVRILTEKNVLHLFEYSDYLGDKFTLSQRSDKLNYDFNDNVSSYASFNGPWKICENENGQGKCLTITGPNPKFSPNMSGLCDDCASSVTS